MQSNNGTNIHNYSKGQTFGVVCFFHYVSKKKFDRKHSIKLRETDKFENSYSAGCFIFDMGKRINSGYQFQDSKGPFFGNSWKSILEECASPLNGFDQSKSTLHKYWKHNFQNCGIETISILFNF